MTHIVLLVLALTWSADPAPTPVSRRWGVAVFPAKGQTPAQQDRDEFDCYQWAKQATGTDPLDPGQPAPSEAAQAGFNRSFAACLEGKGYTTK